MNKPETNAGGINDPAVAASARQALALISDGMKVGLGSGRASSAFIEALGRRVQTGLRVECVPTSDASEKLARQFNIPLIELAEDVELDVVVDGADEVSPELDLIKGWGGALVRERIVTEASRRQIILVGPEKWVRTLGERGRIPVEIIPLAKGYATRKLRALGLTPALRLQKNSPAPFVSDNGNLTLDCALSSPLPNGAAARALQARILEIAGVVDTGMFLGTCSQVLMGKADGRVEVRERA